MASTYLTRTPASSTTTDAWTYSVWVKRANLGATSDICVGRTDGSNQANLQFQSDDTLFFDNYTGGGITVKNVTNRVFRDPGAWYHIVLDFDSSTAGARSAADRMKIWINGVRETSFSTETQAGADATTHFCQESGCQIRIGASNGGSATATFEGVMAHNYYVAGVGHPATVFGEFDATSGIWVAKNSVSVTYGTNGFFLKYQDTAAFGDDSSGNTNDFALAAGTMTQTKDTPDSNFATWNPLYMPHTGVSPTFSNGNTTCISQNGSADYWGSASTLGMVSGKWYAEFKAVTASNKPSFGIVQAPAQHQYNEVWIGNMLYDYAYVADGTTYNDNSLGSGTWNTFTAGDIIGVAVDLTNLKIYFSKNGVWENSGDPTSGATGTGSAFTLTSIAASTVGIPTSDLVECGGSYHFACSDQSTAGDTMSANFGNGYFQTTAVTSANADDAGIGAFEYDVPTGYYALCTTNLGDQS